MVGMVRFSDPPSRRVMRDGGTPMRLVTFDVRRSTFRARDAIWDFGVGILELGIGHAIAIARAGH
jgi:hypothetical protein